ncbi:hypothetical protein SUGI_0797010 [Cryptomeria japonica]|nr:hypothetical protein SUGI_0797010 [Cryptomeria japonica]
MANVRGNPNEWEPTLNRLKQFDTITDDVLPTLRLSFYALPHYLKPCFLFFSAYLEDNRMGCDYLVQVWIGEGFVTSDETQDPYEFGRSYLKLLVNRCMIEFLLCYS